MNRLSQDRRALIVSAIVEGMSLRATARIADCARNTVSRLVRELGHVCHMYQDMAFRNLPCRVLEVDEIWAFIRMKQRNVTTERVQRYGPHIGNIWCWTSICADTKLIPSWLVGDRSQAHAIAFMQDVARRMRHRVQITSDGLSTYPDAVEIAFGADVDYAQLVKEFGGAKETRAQEHAQAQAQAQPSRRYSPPAACTSTSKQVIHGDPKLSRVSTSFAERANLSIRMGVRRYTRLTNAFSRSIDYHRDMLAIWFMHYNYVRVHQSLRTSPAMAAGVTRQLWSVRDLVELLR